MLPAEVIALLTAFKEGTHTLDQTVTAFTASSGDIGHTVIDHERAHRSGQPEVIYGAGKTLSQITDIVARMTQLGHPLICTRATLSMMEAARTVQPAIEWFEAARIFRYLPEPLKKQPGTVAVVTAGTSDMAVAEEAAVTLESFGNQVDRFYDVGVAGIHRLFNRLEEIRKSDLIIAVAGMEGALPSVLGGLVSAPVIAVPTSVGYGVATGGFTTLAAMLTSCAQGITVVNIDNGFGAASAAHRILSQIYKNHSPALTQ